MISAEVLLKDGAFQLPTIIIIIFFIISNLLLIIFANWIKSSVFNIILQIDLIVNECIVINKKVNSSLFFV